MRIKNLYKKTRSTITQMPKKRRAALGVALLIAVSTSAWATESWVGHMSYMGNPPGDPSGTQVSVPSGVSSSHGCEPIDYGGGCWTIYNGNLASSGDIKALSNQVYDLQVQMAKDISWLGYYTARAVRDSDTANNINTLQNDQQVPANMPCGADDCTAEANVASDTAGASGVFGTQNPISGIPMVAKQVKQGLLAQHTSTFLYSSYASHNQLFCSQSEIKAGICSSSASVSNDPNGDIEGTSLLSSNGTQNPAHPTLAADAREAFIQNITNQLPVPALPKKAYQSPLGQMAVGAKLQYQAEQSLAQTALDQIAALHEPVQGLGTILNKTVQGLGMPNVSANVSLLQYMSYMEKAQYGNPKFYANLATQTSSVSLLREVVLMQSQQLLYQYLAMRMRMAQDAMMASEYASQAQAQYAKVAQHFDNSTDYSDDK